MLKSNNNHHRFTTNHEAIHKRWSQYSLEEKLNHKIQGLMQVLH